MQIQQAKLRQFSLSDSERSISFLFEHKGIPVGSQTQAHGGYYNFLLPPNFRLTDLHIVDPYDSTQDNLIHKKHFRHDVLWDTTCNTSLVKMFLTSSRGTFSFVLVGTAQVFDPSQRSNYIPARESEYVVSGMLDYHIISRETRDTVADDIAKKSEWLELKPNFMGIGINLNKIIQDSAKAFRRKIKAKE